MFAGERLGLLTEAYDRAMAVGEAPDFRIGSSTTRLNNLAVCGLEFAEVCADSLLLATCAAVLDAGKDGSVPAPMEIQLSSLLGRTLRPHTAAQDLHVDLPRGADGGPLAGFILMLDEFRAENGATRFVPGSHRWAGEPSGAMKDRKAAYPDKVLAIGLAGSVIVFDAAVWHGHGANVTNALRRSVQGYFVQA